jgi:hypothetical protein
MLDQLTLAFSLRRRHAARNVDGYSFCDCVRDASLLPIAYANAHAAPVGYARLAEPYSVVVRRRLRWLG